MEFIEDGIFPHVILGKGILYKLFKAEVTIMNIVVLATLMYHFFTLSKSKRRHELNFVLACLFPSTTCLLYGFGFFNIYDPSSASFAIAGALVLVAIYRHELFDIIHTARESVIETMEEALVVVDTNYCLLDHNPSAEKLFPELYHCPKKEMLQDISPFLDDLFQHRMLPEFEHNGRYYRTQITKIYNRLTLVGYSAWIFDTTESRLSMENQIQLREQAEHANQAKSIFLANMSHEIRTPLNTILGLTDIILNQNINYQVRSDIILIKTAGSTLLSIINDILDLSKIESGKMSFVNEEYKLTSVIKDVIGIISVKLTQKPIILKVETDKNLPKYLIGDELRFRQVLINILNNAVKFTDKGSISLSVKGNYPDNGQANMIMLHIEVKDTGRGIDPKDQQRIFEMFEQAGKKSSHSTEGSGLGLPLCQRMLSMVGGSISVESEIDKGSTFTITLPQEISQIDHEMIAPAVSDTPNEVPAETNMTPQHYTALVVDDNPLNLLVAKGLLNLFELDVTAVESSMAAIDLLNNRSYDIIFLDYMMPDMDGIETLHAIRALEPPYCKTIPIVALTANAVNGVDKLFIKEGFHDYLSKPIDLKKLSGLLNRWLSIRTGDVLKQDKTTLQQYQTEAFQHFSKIYNIDWNAGLTNCASQWHTYFETLALFSNDGIRQLEQLNKAHVEKDYPLYTIWVHALKSSLLTIGIHHLAQQALELELASKDNNIAYIEANHMPFLQKCNIQCHAIAGFLSAKEYTHFQ
jgi:signal transduction histidine kinase/response regulator of citrate/malate metabolism